MNKSQKAFIKMIAEPAVKYYKKYKILPSLTIAQAILESGWGASALARDCHNYFGMKWSEGCGEDYKSYHTSEQRKDGSFYTVYHRFRKYPSPDAGIKGYYKFLQYERYKPLKGITDYKKATEKIKQAGWATAIDYDKKLIRIIEENKLTKYDEKVLPKKPKKEKKPSKSKPKFRVGDLVRVNGKLYWAGDGSGGSIRLKNQEMQILELESKKRYKHYIGIAYKFGSTRIGWAKESCLKKIK